MRREAFSLVELLVVVGILALLAAILMPALGAARAHGRATVCASNLHTLGQAFETSYNARAGRGAAGGTVTPYPGGYDWPGIPMDSVPTLEVYRCPEDEVAAGWDSLQYLEYLAPGGVRVKLSEPANGSWFITRTGQDANGVYRDFAIQDDGATTGMSFSGWIDTDGVFRVYEDGRIWIIGTVPDTPEWQGATPRTTSSCTDANFLYMRGLPAFGPDGRIRDYANQTLQIQGWEGRTNYGLNRYASQAGDPGTLVLMDYKRTVADPDTAALTASLLDQSGRHLGRVQVLRADKSVVARAPLELSPVLNLPLWKP